MIVELGFSNSEAKVIEALHYLREGTVRQIYERTRLDRAEIYRILNKLNSKGMLEEIIEFPKKFRIIPLHDIFKLKLREEENRLKKLNEKTSNLLIELSTFPKLDNTFEAMDRFEFIVGGSNIIKLQSKLLTKCRNVVRSVLDIYGPYRTLGQTKGIVCELINKGIEVRYLLPVNSINFEQVKELINLGIKVKNLKDIKSRIMMVDSSDALLITSNNLIPRYSKEDKALWIRSKILTHTMVQMFDFIWEKTENSFN
ncbi:MAG: helix-turn-helix domain-containing protein [Nitrososphaerales archaeon]